MKKYYFSCIQGIIKEGKLYAMALDANAICLVDFQRRRAEVIRWMDKYDYLSSGEYWAVCQAGGNLVLIPAGSDYVILYDFEKDSLMHIRVMQPKMQTNKKYHQEKKFGIGFSANNNIYLLGLSYPTILKINADNCKTSYLDEWIKEVQNIIPENDTSPYFAYGYLLDGKNVYIPGRASGTMFGLDLLTDRVTVYAKHNDIKMIHGIVRVGEKIWVMASLDNRESLLLWSPKNGFRDEIVIQKNQLKHICWWNPLESGGYIYLCQMNGKDVYRINMQKRIVEPCEKIMNAIGGTSITNGTDSISVIPIGQEKEKIIFHTRWNRKWFIYDTQDQSIESFRIEISDEEYEYRCWNGLKKKPYITDATLQLKDFLNIVKEGGISRIE